MISPVPLQVEQVATISANNDASVGEILAKAIDAVGKEGVSGIR